MGYWPNKVKRRRHNWVTELGRKLVLLGCTGHHEFVGMRRTYPAGLPSLPRTGQKMYVVNRPGYEGEKAWDNRFTKVQCKGWSEDSVTVKGARMMEII